MPAVFSKLLVLACLFCLGMPAFSQTPVDVGGTTLMFPAHEGFAIAPPASPEFIQSDQWTVNTNRQIAIYAPALGKNDRLAQDARKIVIQTFRQTEAMKVTLADFQGLRSEFRRSNQAILDYASKHASGHLPKTNKEAKSIEVGAMRPIELFSMDPASITMLSEVTYSKMVNGTKREMPMAMGMTVFLMKGKICFLYVYSALEAPDAIKWVKAQSVQWLSEAQKLN
jgi:hypothetical protein